MMDYRYFYHIQHNLTIIDYKAHVCTKKNVEFVLC